MRTVLILVIVFHIFGIGEVQAELTGNQFVCNKGKWTRPCSGSCNQTLAPYQFANGLCLLLKNESLSWNEAEMKCKTFGGELLSVHSEQQNNDVKDFLHRNRLDGTDHVWMGAQLHPDGNHTWVDNSSFVFNEYDHTPPDELCGTIIPADGSWNYLPCTPNVTAPRYVCRQIAKHGYLSARMIAVFNQTWHEDLNDNTSERYSTFLAQLDEFAIENELNFTIKMLLPFTDPISNETLIEGVLFLETFGSWKRIALVVIMGEEGVNDELKTSEDDNEEDLKNSVKLIAKSSSASHIIGIPKLFKQKKKTMATGTPHEATTTMKPQ